MKNLIFFLGVVAFAYISEGYAQDDAPVVQASPSGDAAALSEQPDSTPDNSHLSLEQRVVVLERQVSAANQVGLMNQVNDLQSQLQELQGQVEQLSHTIQTLQSQSTSQYADLDQRLTKLGGAASAVAKTTGSSQDSSSDASEGHSVSEAASTDSGSSNEQHAYEAAYDKVKSGDDAAAIVGLKKFLGQFPSGVYAPNAHYWLGQMYLLKGDGRNAAKEFGVVIKQYPQNPKIKDAKLKLGFAYLLQNKNVQAKAQFKKVIAEYPESSTAKLARARLAQMS